MRLIRRKRKAELVEPNRFIDLADLDLGTPTDGTEPKVKVAEMKDSSDVSLVSDQVYKGNIVIVDYSSLKDDAEEVSRISSQLAAVSRDCNGDVVSVGRTLIVVTPNGMRIDRNRLRRDEP